MLEGIQAGFGKPVSLADLIVLGGTAAVEKAAADGGVDVEVPFTPGPPRRDARSGPTPTPSRRSSRPRTGSATTTAPSEHRLPAEYLLLDRANLLTLSAPGDDGARRRPARRWARTTATPARRPHRPPGTLSNDFFVNLLDLGTAWTGVRTDVYEGRDRETGELQLDRQHVVDLVFGSNSELRALAEVYARDDASEKFVRDFVAAWVKVMNLDRFDLRWHRTSPGRPLAGRPGPSPA